MQGRLHRQARCTREFFFDRSSHGHGIEGCNYLLALDMEMDPMPGYAIASWERGYGDFALRPTSTRCVGSRGSRGRRSCSATSPGTTARRSRRRRARCCKAQVERARGAGLRADGRLRARVLLAASETYEEAHAKHYRDLTPSVPYILDYHVLATTYDEPLHPADPERHARRRASRSRARRARPGRASRRSTSATPTR